MKLALTSVLLVATAGCGGASRVVATNGPPAERSCSDPLADLEVESREPFSAQLDLDPELEEGELVRLREDDRSMALIQWREPGERCPRSADPSILFLALGSSEQHPEELLASGYEPSRLAGWEIERQHDGHFTLRHGERSEALLPDPRSARAGLDLLSSVASALERRTDSHSNESSDVWIEPNFVWVAADGGAGRKERSGPCSPDWWIGSIGADDAWTAHRQVETVRLGLLDSGVDCDHQEIEHAIEEPTRPPTFARRGHCSDPIAHGTKMAGLIVADHDVDKGDKWRGVAPGTRLVPLSVIGTSSGKLASANRVIEALRWARANDIDILSASLRVSPNHHSKELRQAVVELAKHEILLVAAAPNENVDLDVEPSYPASYDLDHVLTVSGVGSDGKWLWAHGADHVELAAPADCVRVIDVRYTAKVEGGTSVATALVAGAAALVASQEADLTPQEIAARLRASLKRVGAFRDRCEWSGALCLEGLYWNQAGSKPTNWCSSP